MFHVHYYAAKLTAGSLIILSLILSGCQILRNDQNNFKVMLWKYGDLKLIDPIDSDVPEQDLVAVYARKNDQSFQLRLDFLSLDQYLKKDIYIPIDTNSGGQNKIITENNDYLVSDVNWDYLLILTDSGKIEVVDVNFSKVISAQIFVIYDSSQDRIIIDITRHDLPILSGKTKFQVLITPPGLNKISNKSLIFSLDTPSPARSKVVFAFWNTFNSSTPAQTLRSWSGAHAGPMSSRHGLKYLINAAAQTRSTIILLDLLTPYNISALDYINALPKIKELAGKGILGLPATGFYGELIDINKEISDLSEGNSAPNLNKSNGGLLNFDLSNMNIRNNPDYVYLWSYYLYSKYKNLNKSVYDYAHYNYDQQPCEFSTINSAAVPFRNILSGECKKILVSNAYNHVTSPLILGGDFSNSLLGDPTLSTEVFSYFAAHPWIQVLSLQDLHLEKDLFSEGIPSDQKLALAQDPSFQRQRGTISGDATSVQASVYSSLLDSPRNRLTDLAWQVYYSLIEPGTTELVSLRSNYIGQIGLILEAADWAEEPKYLETCSIDLDYDGINECILANDHIFIEIELDGGYIPFIFSIDSHGPHQIIGPTWEFIVGLSDPSSWYPNSGVSSDPSQVLGAFQDEYSKWKEYDANISDGRIELFYNKLAMRKSVSIFSNTVRIDIQNTPVSDINPVIPLVVDPWQRFTPHWGDSYSGSVVPSGFIWGINTGVRVEVDSTNTIDVTTFNKTRAALYNPEDPNYDYLGGHYIPFPMAMVELMDPENISVDIQIYP
jgi:hypothetical protein